MAFNAKALRKVGMTFVGAGDVVNEWLYATNDARATVEAANYFTDKRLKKGDIIRAVMARASTPPAFESYGITAFNASFQATIARESATGLTDNTGGTTGSALALASVKVTVKTPVPALANLANAMVLKEAIPFAFTLVSWGFRVGDKAVTTAAKAATAQSQIAGVATTGGLKALVSADLTPTGALVAASDITALNAGVAGDTLEYAISSVTAFAEGNGWFEATVINKDLANALASLNAA